MPVACGDRVHRENVVPRAQTTGEGTGCPVAPEPPQMLVATWILVQLRGFAVLPAGWPVAAGSPDALVTIFAPLEPNPWLALGQPRTVEVPSALPLHGIDFVVHMREVQIALDAVARVDGPVVRDSLLFAHGLGGLRSPSLHLLLPQP